MNYQNVQLINSCLFRFRYITCKHPGSTHDAKVLRDSGLYNSADTLIPRLCTSINGVDIPCFLLGDPAYPLLPWLIKGYKGKLTAEEESFNVYHSRGRVVVENAFGRLKARFRCLLKRIDINYEFVPQLVNTCVILHNIIESKKEKFLQSWLTAVEEYNNIFPQPKKTLLRGYDSLEASIIRDTLKIYMTTFPLKKSTLH